MSNTTLIIIAIVVVVLAIAAVALLRRKPPTIAQPGPKPSAKEGHGLADSAAAAMLDVSTPIL